MFRIHFVATVVLTTALATAASGQPAAPPPVPLVNALVPYLGDENVQKELKLSADQSKKLIAYRQKTWDRSWITAPKDTDIEAQNKATEAEFKAVLSADQLKRANQLAAQVVWSNRGFGPRFGATVLSAPETRAAPVFALAQYPTIADALKLDETQKKLVAAGQFGGPFNTSVYLTAEQSATAKELLGDAYKGPMRGESDPREQSGLGGGFNPRFGGTGVTATLQYTSAKDVQTELKLTEQQIKALTELIAKRSQPIDFEEFQKTSPEARKKANDELLAATIKALDTILSADQRKRLKQIERQQSGTSAFFAGSDLAKDVGVDEAQLKRYAEVNATQAEVVTKAVLSGDPFEKVKARVEAANKDHETAVQAILTDAQKAKQKELLGETFTGNPYGGGFGGGGLNIASLRKLQFGRYGTELNMLILYKGVQDELKISEEQLKKLTEARTEFLTKFPARELAQARQDPEKGDKMYAERSAFVEKALGDVLKKEQFARFRELMLQQLDSAQGGLGFGPIATGAAGFPGVAEAIKLTDEQKKKLIEGEASAEVLTADQKKAIKGMLGEPVKVAEVFNRPNFGGGPGARPALPPAVQLLLNTSVWGEVKLTPDQLAKFVPAANEYNLVTGTRGFGGGGGFGGGPGGGGFGAPQPTAKEVTAATEKFTEVANALLTAEQKKRLAQLAVQQEISASLVRFLVGPPAPAGVPVTATSDAAKALALTDEQKKVISALGTEAAQLSMLLNGLSVPFGEVQQKLRDHFRALVLKELTAEQRTKLDELKGEPFAGFVAQPFGFGGPGGGFGGGLGGGGFGGIVP